jgi:site-specific DNA-methyltransferase (adenine-specific)
MVPEPPRDRRTLKEMARALVDEAGFVEVEENVRIAPGVSVSLRAVGPDGTVRLIEVAGSHTPARPGLSRIDAVWRTIAKAAVVRESDPGAQLVVLTSGTVRGGPLASVVGAGKPIAAVIDVTRSDAVQRLTS